MACKEFERVMGLRGRTTNPRAWYARPPLILRMACGGKVEGRQFGVAGVRADIDGVLAVDCTVM